MSGSEEYSSAEDEDYVPSGAEYSEDDVSELVREEAADSPRPPCGRRSPRRPASRKRKKGGLLLEPDDKEEEKAQQNEEEEEEVDNVEQVERNREEEEKKKEDALWASFLSDVGRKPKVVAATQVMQTKKGEEEKSGNKLQEKPKESEKPKDSGKVTITKVFDFAGEEVRVTKEVDSTSKEAKSFLKQQEKWQLAAPASLPTVSGVRPVCSTAVQWLEAPTHGIVGGCRVRRPSGMSSLLGKIGSKKQKMSTLEKSKLDWENFKEEEGIVEELAIHNRGKDGYIERKAFLERVDHRQFEIERDIRLSRMKP
ncbi:craniofacial development protein 1 isoform X1 [Harpia harpyja]|uniref:craniofacial development protein 1 isoform X1 n=1 Tax=Harpia harpyja TaxID=202280 RepID=UPI0022B0F3CC|nr:craniofacial development protein 1 isoform X1 [Harpia harpyja]